MGLSDEVAVVTSLGTAGAGSGEGPSHPVRPRCHRGDVTWASSEVCGRTQESLAMTRCECSGAVSHIPGLRRDSPGPHHPPREQTAVLGSAPLLRQPVAAGRLRAWSPLCREKGRLSSLSSSPRPPSAAHWCGVSSASPGPAISPRAAVALARQQRVLTVPPKVASPTIQPRNGRSACHGVKVYAGGLWPVEIPEGLYPASQKNLRCVCPLPD